MNEPKNSSVVTHVNVISILTKIFDLLLSTLFLAHMEPCVSYGRNFQHWTLTGRLQC